MTRIVLGAAAIAIIAVLGYMLASSSDYSWLKADKEEDAKKVEWVAAAPGRVEPRKGEVHIGTAILGRISEVYVRVNDAIEEDQLLFKLDDTEARARLAAAETEADVREKIRDDQRLSSSRKEVRDAEDEVYRAERSVTGARIELDYALAGKRDGSVSERRVEDARRRLKEAQDRVDKGRIEVAKAQTKSNLPAPSRAEAAVSEARAQVAIAEALLDKTRVRAPRKGTVLILNAKRGEMVAPSPAHPLIVLGDMSVMEVKAEVDEADYSKIELDQRAYVESVSHPNRQFEGKVVRLAPALSAPNISQRGPRRPTDVKVMEVTVELEGDVPLLPGMRVDTFFK